MQINPNGGEWYIKTLWGKYLKLREFYLFKFVSLENLDKITIIRTLQYKTAVQNAVLDRNIAGNPNWRTCNQVIWICKCIYWKSRKWSWLSPVSWKWKNWNLHRRSPRRGRWVKTISRDRHEGAHVAGLMMALCRRAWV